MSERCDVKQTSRVDHATAFEHRLKTYECPRLAVYTVWERGEPKLCCEVHLAGWRRVRPDLRVERIGPTPLEVEEAIESIKRAVS